MVELPERYANILSKVNGGFGEVLFCEDNHLDRQVAIKFLLDPADSRRIHDELRALMQMRSKHVVQIYDVVPQSNGTMGIVEEFILGDDLVGNSTTRKSPDDFLKILWQISAGIADIHNAGLIHRDIKPNNMKIDPEGIVKIFDFGLARESGGDAVTKGFIGTFGFAAPELFGRDTVRFTTAIDTYAFGATALYLSTGELRPFTGEPPGKSEIFQTLSSCGLAVPQQIIDIVAECLLPDPKARPNMMHVRDVIASYLLKNKHRALGVTKKDTMFLDANNRRANLKFGDIGAIGISYDGFKFYVHKVEKEVYINNTLVVAGMILPHSCVVGFGQKGRPHHERTFMTFDISNPEIAL